MNLKRCAWNKGNVQDIMSMSNKLKVSLINAKELTLDDYIHDIRIVWNRLDSERSIYDTWLHTVNHASKLGEEVRRGRFDKVLNELADITMWFLTFVGRLQESPKSRIIRIEEERLLYTPLSLTDIVWSKYPNICPVCFFRHYERSGENELWGRKCDCLLNLRQVETRNELLSTNEKDKLKKVAALSEYAANTKNKHEKLSKVEDIQSMFERIFEANIDNLSLESLTFHLLEEIGEVSDALIRVYTYKKDSTPPAAKLYPQRIANLENELADVVSWIFAICLKVKYLYEAYDELAQLPYRQAMAPTPSRLSGSINFWEILWRRYGHPNAKSLWCPVCGVRICECPVTFATDTEKQQAMGLSPNS
ncbi:hypothetical protein ES703_41325 [subsurface metagenome]